MLGIVNNVMAGGVLGCYNIEIEYKGHYQKMEKYMSYTIFSHPQLQLSSFSLYNT